MSDEDERVDAGLPKLQIQQQPFRSTFENLMTSQFSLCGSFTSQPKCSGGRPRGRG